MKKGGERDRGRERVRERKRVWENSVKNNKSNITHQAFRDIT